MDHLNWLITINFSTLCAVILFGARMLRFFNRMEFKVEEMWLDYKSRTQKSQQHSHSRREDE